MVRVERGGRKRACTPAERVRATGSTTPLLLVWRRPGPVRGTSAGTERGNGSAEIKGWETQGRDITADVTGSDKYKSMALHAEVKLAEALERCARLCPTSYNSDGEAKPNKLKTAVCCQVRAWRGAAHQPWGAAGGATSCGVQQGGARAQARTHRRTRPLA